jgi:hypothetical protein
MLNFKLIDGSPLVYNEAQQSPADGQRPRNAILEETD